MKLHHKSKDERKVPTHPSLSSSHKQIIKAEHLKNRQQSSVLWTRAESGAVVERFCQLDPSEHVGISLYGSVRTLSRLSRVKIKWHFLLRGTRGSKVIEHGSITSVDSSADSVWTTSEPKVPDGPGPTLWLFYSGSEPKHFKSSRVFVQMSVQLMRNSRSCGHIKTGV